MLGYFNLFFHGVPNWNGQPAYARPRRCHLSNTHMFDYFVRGCVPYFVSLATSFQAHRPDSSFLFQTKTALHSSIYVAVIILSDIPLENIQPKIPHVNWVRLVHIYPQQVPFSLSKPYRHVLNEKELIV